MASAMHLGQMRGLAEQRGETASERLVHDADKTSIATLCRVFPPLAVLKKSDDETISLVNRAIVEEVLLELGELDFGKGVIAKSNVALWRTRGEHMPLVGGFALPRPIVTAMLKGVAAAAVGLIVATIVQLGKQSLTHRFDLEQDKPGPSRAGRRHHRRVRIPSQVTAGSHRQAAAAGRVPPERLQGWLRYTAGFRFPNRPPIQPTAMPSSRPTPAARATACSG